MQKNAVFQRIQQELKASRVVLFMKGTPADPKCGFSADASKRLKDAGIAYKSVNVLEDPSLFDGIRQFTNYTHFPQMFVDGRFVGSNENINRLMMQHKL